MNNFHSRLATCFFALFPDLDSAELEEASVETVPTWDSVASATLMSLIEEEFEIELDIEQIGMLNSFAGAKQVVEYSTRLNR